MPVDVLNKSALAFPSDVRVAVLNKNDATSVLRFDGNDHEFPSQEAVIVDCQTAFALFAVDTRTPEGYEIKLRRDKQFGKEGTSNSVYDECLIKYGATDPRGRQWFDNFSFKLVKTTKKMAARDFDSMK